MRIDSKKCFFEDGTASNMSIISVGIISGLDGAINGPLLGSIISSQNDNIGKYQNSVYLRPTSIFVL